MIFWNPIMWMLLGVLSQDGGVAPRDTLNPLEIVAELIGTFSNCSFTGTHTFRTVPAVGNSFSQTTQVRALICEEVMVIQRNERTDSMVLRDGTRIEASTRCTEDRWDLNEPGLGIEVKEKWPLSAASPDEVIVNSIMAYPKQAGDLNIVWKNLLLRNFTDPNHPTAIGFREMATDGGRRGYRLKDVQWVADDHSKVSYQFESESYGKTSFQFSKLNGKWVLSSISIVKLADDKIQAIDEPGRDRVKNALASQDFSIPVKGVDRLEVEYQINYDGALPKSMARVESQYVGDEVSKTISELTLDELKVGGVTPSEVRKAMIPLANGVSVLYDDDELGRLSWVMENGKVIKSLNTEAGDVGNAASFNNSWSRGRAMMVSIAVLVVLISTAIFVRRRMPSGK